MEWIALMSIRVEAEKALKSGTLVEAKESDWIAEVMAGVGQD